VSHSLARHRKLKLTSQAHHSGNHKNMNRRQFFCTASAAGGMALLPAAGIAQAGNQLGLSQLAGGVFYTRNHAGRWSNMVGGHLPKLRTHTRDDGQLQVTVSNDHEMRGYEHYIVKHVLLDHDMRFLGEMRFDPRRDPAPTSQFVLESYNGPLYALSMCNQHDIWLNGIDI
jgi:superoxide reductase